MQDQRKARAIDGLDMPTDYAYGATGKPRRVTDPAGRVIQFDHDAWGRQTSSTDQARGGTETTDYDGLDQVRRTVDAAGRGRDRRPSPLWGAPAPAMTSAASRR